MEEKEIEILQNAARIFMRFGIKSVTMDDIAREMAVSKKTLYKYFADKNDLVNKIIDAKLNMNFEECNAAKKDSVNAIDELFLINKMVRQQFATIHPSVFYDMQKYHPTAWQKMNAFRQNHIRLQIEENTVTGIKEGLYRQNVHVEISAQFYLVLVSAILAGEMLINDYQILFKELMRNHVRALATEKGIEYLIDRINKDENE